MGKIKLVEIREDGKVNRPIKVSEHINQICEQNTQMYKKTGFTQPWVAYLVFDGVKIVGTCAFKGPPTERGVEIAYHTFKEFEGKGYATQMIQSLLAFAEFANSKLRVYALTLAEKNASSHMLKKAGFSHAGESIDAEVGKVWEWDRFPKGTE